MKKELTMRLHSLAEKFVESSNAPFARLESGKARDHIVLDADF